MSYKIHMLSSLNSLPEGSMKTPLFKYEDSRSFDEALVPAWPLRGR